MLLPRLARFAALALACTLALTACDSADDGGNTITLQPKTVTFAFPPFDGSTATGGTLTLDAENTVRFEQTNDDADLSLDGFRRSEVRRARVTEVVLVRTSTGAPPTGLPPTDLEVLGFLEEAAVAVDGTTVAEQVAGFDPNDFQTVLGLEADTDVTGTVRGDAPFGATLRLGVDPDDIGGGPFRLEANVTFRIEVAEP